MLLSYIYKHLTPVQILVFFSVDNGYNQNRIVYVGIFIIHVLLLRITQISNIFKTK